MVRPSSARQFHRVLEGRAGGCVLFPRHCGCTEHRLGQAADARGRAHMTIFSHPTRIAEAVGRAQGGALRYEEEL